MATNMNLPRKPNLGEYGSNNMPMDFNSMSMNKATSPNISANLPLSQNAIGEAALGNHGPNPFPQNHFNQGMGNFARPPRQFQDNLENLPRMKYPNSNMATGAYGGVYDSNSSEPYQLAMARKFRPQDMYGMNKNMDQTNFPQQRNMGSSSWPVDYGSRNNRQRSLPMSKAVLPQQARVDPNLGSNMAPDQNFPSPGATGSPQQPYQMPGQYMTGDMFKQSRDRPFASRGMASNFNPQEFYQQEQLRQMSNQYHQPSVPPHAAGNYLTPNHRNSSSPFGQSVIPKPSQDAMHFQQFSSSPKPNGPHTIVPNVVDERQMAFPNSNYPVSPAGSQMAGKPGYASSLGMRGTVSPNVTIGMPKKPPYRQQQEEVTSPGANQNARAAAAAAAVLAAAITTNPSSQSDTHNISRPPSVPSVPNIPSRPPSVPSVPNMPSRPPSIHAKDPRSPSTSIISDHKSESGGSGINDIRTTPSPARSLSRNTPQLSETNSAVNFPSDIEAVGRVPSPSMNQLPTSDIEAMIQSVSNIPGGAVPSTEQSTAAPQKSKPENKSETSSKANHGRVTSPVTPPSPFSLSPSINVDFDIDMLSPSWEDSSSRSATPLSKLYKLSEEPERKEFLDKLVLLMEQQGKDINEIPNFNGSILDLYKFYHLVWKRGGMQEVVRLKLWKDVGQALTNSTPSNEDEQLLREHYIRLLLPFEEKFGAAPLQPAPTGTPTSTHSSNPPANAESGSIDLSKMTYQNLFQPNSSAPSTPYSQGGTPSMQQPSYPNTPPASQGYPSTPPMQHPGYRNAPGFPQGSPGYPGYPQGSPRVPSYPAGHPGYSNHQYPNFQGPTSQMPGYHNDIAPSPRYPNYPRNTLPSESMYGQFARGPGMNKSQFQHDPQSQGMFPNYPQQGQHPPGYMYQQQASNMAAYQMERQRTAQRGGMGSPRPRMQSPWGQRYPDGAGPSSGSPSPFHNSQSPGLKPSRPPPPYPHPKQEKPSPTPQSAAAALQYQAMKAGVKLPVVKREEELFPAGCVETTQAVHTKKRRLTARDVGPVEAWRIMMSLKSGLLTETAWALDTLTILLSDDATVGFFRLAHLPGFLDTVIEHFRRNLINIFGVLRENEIDTGITERYIYGSTKETAEKLFSGILPDHIATENFSSIIVTGCLTDTEERGFRSGAKDWSSGGGDTTIHIQTHFETDPRFYDDVKEDDEIANLTENCSKDECVETSCTNAEDENVSRIFENTDNVVTANLDESSEKDPEALVKDVHTEVNTIHNGIPSPDGTDTVAKSVNDSEMSFKEEILSWEKNCCNGVKSTKDNCNEGCPSKLTNGTSANNVEPDSSVEDSEKDKSSAVKVEPSSLDNKDDPSTLLIKRLKTELDLDIETVSNDTEDAIPNVKSCNISTSAPTDAECELKQEFPLSSVTLSQDAAINACNCVSNIIRNLSFVPGNDVEMAKNPSLLLILAKLLLLHHMKRKKALASDSQYNDSDSWWHDCLDTVRENTLVTVANIAGYLDLSLLAGNVSRLLIDGILHWLVCESTVADEPLRSTSMSVVLTPKQLVLETLAKMSVLEANVDFILNSPDKSRLTKAYEYLVKLFSDKTNEVTREFALVLLSSFTQANQEICSANSERNLVTVLVGFLEDARDKVESMAVRGLHPGMFRDNDLRVSMGMLRRAGSLLACIAKRTRSTHLLPFQERILDLSMSRSLDAEVQSHLSNVLYNLPR